MDLILHNDSDPEVDGWVASYPNLTSRKDSETGGRAAYGERSPEQEAVRRLIKRPSSDNLWVDFSLSPKTKTGEMFAESLVRHEVSNFGSIDKRWEGNVGFAPPSGSHGQGSISSCVFTLVASAMGAGCLSLPHMIKRSGLGLGLCLLAVGAVLAHISLVILMSCARYTGCRSFAELLALSLAPASPKGSHLGIHSGAAGRAKLTVDVVISLYGVAAVLIYMMLIGDFLGGIAQAPIFGGRADEISRGALIVGSLVVLLPLSLPRNVSALRYVCLLSTSSIVFMTLVVVAKMPWILLDRSKQPDTEAIVWVSGGICDTLQSFGIAIFAFAAHTNAVPVAAVLEDPRAVRIWTVSLTSVLVEFVIYALIAVCGYLSFLGETRQDFITNYPADDPLMLAVRCVYSVPVLFGVPINLSPAAASLQALMRQVMTDSSSPEVPASPRWQHAAIVTVVLASCAAVAIHCEDVADVIGLLGSFFGTLICLWWPQRIYQGVLGNLHPRRLRVFLRGLLLAASCLGLLAFTVLVQGVLAKRFA